MATVVFLHAHPDDECLTTGGTIARLASEGHRVVLVTATDGALGECPEGLLAEGESLAARREREVRASAAALGVTRVHLLGYADSGMVGTEGNTAPGAFCSVDVEEAAAKLASLLQEEGADVMVAYDDHGGYGHPDHIQVHHVGIRAADIAGTPALYQVTINRDDILRFIAMAAEEGLMEATTEGSPPSPEEMATIGLPEAEITTFVDVARFVPDKLAAMRCHETQTGDMGFFLKMPEDRFRQAFGCEFYVRMRAPEGTPNDHLV
jgi:LmbE family N-acetylglucosaminyl deacetylase